MAPPPNPSLPPLAQNQVHVWQLSLEADPSTLAAYCLLLSADERQRAERFAFPELHRRFVVARATLRLLLGRYADRRPEDLHFIYGPSGKPELAGSPWHFNVSHSGELALIAVTADSPVGVDLEMIRPLEYEAVARGVLPERDRRALAQACEAEKADLFFRAWVRYEAQVKATGAILGMHADVPTYDVPVPPNYRAALATFIQDVQIETGDFARLAFFS